MPTMLSLSRAPAFVSPSNSPACKKGKATAGNVLYLSDQAKDRALRRKQVKDTASQSRQQEKQRRKAAIMGSLEGALNNAEPILDDSETSSHRDLDDYSQSSSLVSPAPRGSRYIRQGNRTMKISDDDLPQPTSFRNGMRDGGITPASNSKKVGERTPRRSAIVSPMTITIDQRPIPLKCCSPSKNSMRVPFQYPQQM